MRRMKINFFNYCNTEYGIFNFIPGFSISWNMNYGRDITLNFRWLIFGLKISYIIETCE